MASYIWPLKIKNIQMKTYNWGIIGPGKIAAKFSAGLMQLDNARLYSVVSRSMDRAVEFAGRFGYEKAYDDYSRFASDPDLDIVYVASPHSHHYEHSIICLENGKAVICEKAFAINSRQVNEMTKAASGNNVFLMEALWPPFQPSYLKAHELLLRPSTGKIRYMISRFAFRAPYESEERLFNPALAGGSLLDIGIYPVIDALTFLGDPDSIETSVVMAETGVDESTGVLFGYNDGRGASLYSSFACDGGISTELFCENANIHLSRGRDDVQSLKVSYRTGESEQYTYKPVAGGFYLEAAEVMKCLDLGLKESSIVPVSFSTCLINTLDRIREKAGIHYPSEK